MATKDRAKSPSAGEALLTVDQVAERLNVSPRAIRRWTDERLLRFIELPRGKRIREADLEAFLEGRVVEPEA